MKLLHLIDNAGAGGPFRSLLTFIRHAKASDNDIEHAIVALGKDAYPPMVFEARRLGVAVVRNPDRDELNRQVEAADVVLIHFWNTPRLWQFITQRPSAARFVIWSMILGAFPPQIINLRLLEQAAAVVLTSEAPPNLNVATNTEIVPGLADFGRLKAFSPKQHAGFNVDYLGTCNIGKIHPHFVRMMERIAIPGISVRIYGGQPDHTLASSIKASRDPSRFHVIGFVEDIRSVFETSDVFGYPLAETTYATSDKSLQEAMYAGIPPVVFPHGGPARFVDHGITGLVATSDDEFISAIEDLYHNPKRRLELGQNARAYAQRAFSPARHVATLLSVIRNASREPRRNLMDRFAIIKDDGTCDAARFLVSQNWEPEAAQFAINQWRSGSSGELDRYILKLSDDVFQIEGGILHWRNTVPTDCTLRWWAALWLLKKARYSESINEVRAARDLGAPIHRCNLLEQLAVAANEGKGQRSQLTVSELEQAFF